MGKQGYINEDEMKDEIDGKKISQLNKNLSGFIIDIFGLHKKDKIDGVLKCIKRGGQNKGDIEIFFKNQSKTVSIKMGSGNSVHQESIEDFIKYLNREFISKYDISDDLRFFVWGDGTLDGKGIVSNRIGALRFAKTHPDVIERIQKYFNNFKKDLIQRFVLNGKNNASAIDYIYYGNKDFGKWVEAEKLLNWLVYQKNESKGAISVGALTFQAWNRNIKGGDKSEHKRGVIQLKWGTMGYDILDI